MEALPLNESPVSARCLRPFMWKHKFRVVLLVLALLFAGLCPSGTQAQTITITTLDTGTGDTGAYCSQAIVNGNPAVAYFYSTGKNLMFARNSAPDGSGTWTVTSVDTSSNDVGRHASLAVINGNPAISYYDSTTGDLKYVRASNANGTAWGTPVVVESSNDVGQHTSLAVVNGNPAISYYNATSLDLRYVRATNASGTTWGTAVTVDSTDSVGTYTSLEVVDGHPAISYYDGTNFDLKYIRASDVSGTAWSPPVIVDSSDSSGTHTSLAIVDGSPAIGYRDEANGYLKYVRASDTSGTAWSTPLTLDSTALVGGFTTLQIVGGNPAISYFDSTNEDLKFIRASDIGGASWDAPVTLDAAGSVGWHASLAVVSGRPAISYYDSTNGDLKYIRASDANGAAWPAGVIADVGKGDVGSFTSQAIIAGNPAISYFDVLNEDLKFIRANDEGGTTWSAPVTVESANDPGRYNSLADINGFPAISYAGGDTNLKYVRATDANGANWNAPVTVAPFGSSTSLALVNGNPAVAFRNYVSANLMYVRASNAAGTSWGGAVDLGGAGDVGYYTSLVIVNGLPAISSYDATNANLQFSRANDANGTSWVGRVDLESANDVGAFTSMFIVNGNPAICYQSGTSTALKYMRALDASGTAWDAPVVVDNTGYDGINTSLKIISGYPAISYRGGSVSNADLKYVRATDSNGAHWGSPLTVDSAGDVGHYTSMAVVNGLPAISYYDATNGNLKWATIGTYPDIDVEQPTGTRLEDGTSTVAFGTVTPETSTAPFTFTVINTGTSDLTLGAITKSGSHPADFAVDTTGMAAVLAPGASTTFTVTFTPGASGARSAMIRLANDVASPKDPFDILLNGNGALSPNANLSGLTFSGGTLGTAFAPGTTDYTFTTAPGATSVSVTPSPIEGAATITVNGVTTTSGQTQVVPLGLGTNTISIVVTAPDGVATKNYTFTGMLPPGTLIRPGTVPFGLKGWWKLDEVSGLRADSSGMGNTLTQSGTVSSSADDYWLSDALSASFTGNASNCLSISDASQNGLDITGSWTASFWVRPTEVSTAKMIFEKGTQMALYLSDLGQLYIYSGGSADPTTGGVYEAGKWNHFTVAYDSTSNSACVYKNGNLISVETALAAPANTADAFVVGRHSSNGQPMNGLLKDLAVWDRPLNPLEVKSLASGIDLSTTYRPGNVTVPPTAWWRLNEVSSGSSTVTRADSAAVSHPMTDNNTVGSAGGYLDGAAATFGGNPSTEYLSSADHIDWDVGTGDFSFSIWVNMASLSGQPTFMADGPISAGVVMSYLGATNQLYCYMAGVARTFAWTPLSNTWYQVVLKRQGGQLSAYVDGKQIGTTLTSTENITGLTSGMWIGVDPTGQLSHMNGRLSDAGFWKGYALSTTEIKALATALPVQKAGIVSYWPLDEASGTRSDAIGTNHLSPVNSPASAAGLVGTAADFESTSSQYLKITSVAQSGLNPTSALSVFGWVRPESTGSRQVIASRGYGNSGYALSYGFSGTAQFDTGPGGAASTSTVSIGNWSFLGGVWDGARKVYFNAAHEVTDPANGPATTTHDFTLGANDLPGEYTDGLVDEVLVARRVFRDEEVKALYLRGLGGIPAMSFLAAQEAGGVAITADGGGSVGFSSQAVETSSAAKTITIWNTSDQTLSNLAVTLTGANAASFVLNTTGTATSLASGASTTFTVAFAPQVGGLCSANVQISSSASVAANPFDIVLSGTGTADVPVITSLSSHNAKPGDSVTITGSGFSAVPGNNAVWFGAAKGAVTAASTTQLTVTVPVGATAGLVSVSVHGLNAFSRRVFTPSYTSAGLTLAGMEFYESGRFAVGTGPMGSLIADVDVDGKPDLLSANGTGNSLSVLRNTTAASGGTPAFAGKVDFATAGTPEGVVAMDILGDGKLDLLASGESAGELHVLRNDSSPGSITSGSFTALAPATGVVYPQRPISCDLDGDGMADLIAAIGQGSSVGIHRQTSPSVFGARQLVSTDSSDSRRVVAADFNSDGKTDLAVSHASGALVLLRNTSMPGVIQFTKDPDLAVSSSCFAISAADLDGDGKDDLIAGMYSSSFVRVWRNISSGSALSFGSPIDLAVEGGVFSVAVGDFNGDGKPDIAAAHGSSAAKVSLIPNTHVSGALSSGSFGTRTYLNTGGTPQHVSIGDLNGDHTPEIVVTMAGTSELAVWRSAYAPAPTLGAVSVTSAAIGTSITITGTNFSTTPADNIVWFGAVKGTVTAATPTQLSVTVPAGAAHDHIRVTVNGRTGWSAQPFLPTFAGDPGLSAVSFAPPLSVSTEDSTTSVAAGDIDGDGAPDVVVSDYTSNRMSVLRNLLAPGSTGTSTAFSAGALAAPVHFPVSLAAHAVVLGDLNNDGKLDAVVSGYSGSSVFVFINTSTPGNIAFSSYVQLTCGGTPLGMTVSDLNGDGRAEILVADTADGTISVFRNRHPGGTVTANSFERFTLSTGGGSKSPHYVTVGDLDGDGKPEIVVTNTVANEVVVIGNHSSLDDITPAAFDAAVAYPTAGSPTPVTLADHDRDGDLDIVTGDYSGDSVTVLRNTGTGSLATRFVSNQSGVTTAGGPYAADVGDLDGDGYPDFAVSCTGNTVSVFRTQAAGGGWTFAPKLNLALGNYGNGGCAIVDLDRDGRPDVVAGSYQGGSVYLIRNIVPPFVPVPTITDLSATSAKPGRSITITGTNFSTTPASNIVWFSGMRGTVTAATNTQLTVTVPNGAQHGPVSVHVGGRTGTSPTVFTPRFQGAGTFSETSFAVESLSGSIGGTCVLGADFDNDGKVDLVTASSSAAVYRNISTPGTLTAASFDAPINLSTGGSGPGAAAVGDLNGDGRLDVAMAVYDGTVRVFENNSASGISFLGAVNLVVGVSYARIAITDFDQDGRPDLVLSGTGTSIPAVIKNQHVSGPLAAASFSAHLQITTGNEPADAASGDLNGDGRPDLIVDCLAPGAGTGPGSISVLANISVRGDLPASWFAAKSDVAAGTFPARLVTGDWDADGKLDVATTNFGSGGGGNVLSIFRNATSTGGITLARQDFNNATGNYGIAAADFDGDRKPDITTANGGTGNTTVSILRNTSTSGVLDSGSFAAPAIVSVGMTPAEITAADFDNDGRPDIIALANGGGLVALRNIHTLGTPQIAVEQPVSTPLVDGAGVLSLGNVTVGQSSSVMTVTIRNTGTADLENLALSLSGAQMAEFSLGTLPTTILPPGATTTFTVTFSPAGLGTRTAALQIASNAAGAANPFDLMLTGSGINGTLTTDFTSGSQTGLTTNGFTATGSTVNLSLGFAPPSFSGLTVVNNTASNPISGTFTNLAQGQTVMLSYGGKDYRFFVDYFGGDGNDLVLVLQGPGVLDYSFNGSGKVKTAIGSGNEQAWDVAVQADGKIVAAGWSHNGSSDDFAVVRYNVDGSLDTGFGTGGKVTTSLGNESDRAFGVEVQPDGKIVLAGLSTNSGVQHVAVVRYNANGTLDTSFDGDGKVVTPVGTGSEGWDVALQSDGKIVVGGDYWSGTDTDFLLVRYNSNGSLDGSFGTGGIVTTTQAGRHDEATCVALTPDGKVVLAGYYQQATDYVIELARYNANGTLDTSFSGDGVQNTQLGASERAHDVVVQPDGKIVLVGQGPGGGGNDGIVLRYNPDGTLDTTFDSDGILGLAMGSYGDYAHGVALQWDGKILVAGITEDGVAANMMLARFLANGTLDASFNGTGKVSTSFGATSSDFAQGMALTPDGRIVLAGLTTVDGTWDFAVARFLVDTERQATFASAATVPFAAGSFSGAGQTVSLTLGFVPTPGQVLTLVDNTGSLSISGEFTNLADGAVISPTYNGIAYPFLASYTGGTGNDLTLTALAGALDATFSTDGIVTTAVGGGADVPYGVAEQSDGKIVAVGLSFNGSNNDFAVLRYLADGSLDGGFGTGGKVTTAIGSGDDTAVYVSLQNDGKIVVSGWSHNGSNNDFAVVRYNANGTLDTTFNGTGKVTTSIGSSDEVGGRNVVQSDGKIVVSGWSESSGNINFALVRYNSNGTLDTSFNGTGKVTTDFSGGQDVSNGLVVQPDGKIIAAGTIPGGPFGMARYNADGSLDTSFGSGGKVTTTVSGGGQGNSVAFQSDGKIILAGYNNPGNVALIDFVVLRYNTDGSLDSTFGTGGQVITDVGGNTDEARKVMIQSNGKIVVSGGSLIGPNYDFSLVRYNTDGSLDTSFNGTGKVTTPMGTANSYAYSMVLQSDGKMLLVGQAHNGSNYDFALARYLVETSHDVIFASATDVPLNANGFSATGQTVDITLSFAPTIGTALTLVNNTGTTPISGTFTNLANGVLVPLSFGGTTYTFTAHYTAGDGNDLVLLLEGPGALDYSFGVSGKVIAGVPFSHDFIYSALTQPDGKTLVVGSGDNGSNSDFALARYHPDGSLDTSFGTMGKVLTPVGTSSDVGHSVVLQHDGRIVVGGRAYFSGTKEDFAVTRYHPDGSLDLSFGTGGIVTTAVTNESDQCEAVALQSDGKIVAAGRRWNGSNFDAVVVRYSANGSLDASFGNGGVVTTPIGSGYDEFHDVAVQGDGKIVAAGYSVQGTYNDFAVVRYLANGSLDTSFGTGGTVTTAIGSQHDVGNRLALQPDGRIVVAGTTSTGGNSDFAVVRYTSAGLLDSTFDGDGKVVTNFGGYDEGNAIALQNDGKILVTGRGETAGKRNFAIARYHVNGTLDTSFHGDGIAWTAIGAGEDISLAVAVQVDGKIVSAGYSTQAGAYADFAVVRYLGDTTHDVTFASAANVPLTFKGLTATGQTLNLTLGFTPNPGTTLKVFDNTSLQPIAGEFVNLAQGAVVTLNHSGTDYGFVANYFGGDGNDLTLDWANTKLAAFGLNDIGQLGVSGGVAQANVPTQVVATSPIYQKTILSVSAGQAHSLAVCADGTVAGWGSNANGQLGNGTTTSATTPVAVTMIGVLNGKKVIAVAAGGQHSLALCSDGTLAAWGDGSFGQIGDGGVLDRTAPVLVSTAGALNGKRVMAISAGATHSAALCSDGTVVCWGDNANGELGNANNTRSLVPVAVSTSGVLLGRTVVAVTCGQNHTLALLADGAVATWGANASKQLGNNSTMPSNVPVLADASGLLNGKRVVRIAAGGQSSLAQCSDGALAAWGLNDRGQLGVNSATTTFGLAQAVDLSGVLSGKTITGIEMGQNHAAALCSDGSLATWGAGTGGQLGNNAVSDSLVPVGVNGAILGGTDVFVSAASGSQAGHTLAVIGSVTNAPQIVVEHPTGTVLVDGSGSQSFGSTYVTSTKTKVFTIKNAGTQALSGIAATINGTVANIAHYSIPVQPPASLQPGEAASFSVNFTPTSTGSKPVTLRIANNLDAPLNPFDVSLTGTASPSLTFTFTAASDVAVNSAAFNAGSKTITLLLGHAPATGANLMVVNNTGTGFITGAFSNLAHGQTVALTFNSITYNFVANYFGGDGNDLVLHWKDTRLLAWGANSSGTLGTGGTTQANIPAAVSMSGVLNGKTIIAVACGERHTLALCSDNTLAAWGANDLGQLGTGNNTPSNVPVAVPLNGALAGKTIAAIAAGYDFSLALCSDGSVAAWGTNGSGQLGNNSVTGSNAPVAVSTAGVLSGKIVTCIAAGYDFAAARCADGTMAAWGANHSGQLGNGTNDDSLVPVVVTASGVLAGRTVTGIATGNYFVLALCSDGRIAAWGDNGFGTLGDGTVDPSSEPVLVSNTGLFAGKTPVQLGAGQYHSAALCGDGTFGVWGDNTIGPGQLGVSGIDSYFTPGPITLNGVLAGKTLAAFAAGQYHNIALLTDGTLAAWGFSAFGQLGNGSTTFCDLPVLVNLTALGAGERIVRLASGPTALHSTGIVAVPLASGGAPVVSTNAAESINKTSATLKGLVNASGTATTAWFEYGLTTSYGSVIPLVPQSVGSGSTSQTFTQGLTGLSPNTAYHFRIVASNTNGTVTGDDFMFTTLEDPPLAVTTSANTITNTTATLTGTVNPTGRATTIYFEFGTTTLYGNTTAPQNIAAGSSNVNVIAPVSGLTLGTTYHFRLVAQNAAGTAHGDDAVFATTSISPPAFGALAASGVTTTGATLNGDVNPNGAISTAYFEYGLTTTYTNVTSTTGIPSGTSTVNISLPVVSLSPGTLYHYRLVAENSAGLNRSADATFTTLPQPPTATTHAATALTTTSARLHGQVNAQNGTAVVTFEWGTDGVNFPNSLTATPSPVTGSTLTDVSVDLANLAQFTTYHYRVTAVSAGGTTTGSVLTFQPAIISGLSQQFPTVAPASNGSLTVTLSPEGLLSGWRFVGEHRWRASGDTATGLVHGSRVIEFRPVPGYLQPGTDTVNVTSAGQLADFEYYATPSAGTGGILVVLKPDTLALASNVAERGQWRLFGETTWRDSATTASSLPSGSYLVECKPVSGYSTPVLINVIVSTGGTANPVIVYGDVSSPTGTLPVVQSFSTVSTDSTKPYGYVGQIRSHSGVASGFAVKSRVVATAAHVVFDEGTLSSAQGLQWLLQEDAGGHEPLPVTPRGYYLIDGYATQRGNESRGSFSLASRQLDAAALYFLNDTAAARTGFSGFLASDLANNEFLSSSSQKMLIGYPVDGITPQDQGRMHATPAANLTFTGLTDRVFATTGIRSTGGNSGGPLCVQHTNGNWYPAAIYLGGATQSIVRAIDSTVIQLFNSAQQSGIDDQGFNNGGATHTGYNGPVTTDVGSAIINITPAGSGWRPLGSTKPPTQSGFTRSSLPAGILLVEFVPVSGYQTPTTYSIVVVANDTRTYDITFPPSQTPQETWRQLHFGTTSNTGNAADNADPDGDRFTNLQEYAAGTNPTLPSDFFKVTDTQRTASTFSVSTAGKAGRSYTLERSTNLTTWTSVGSPQGPLANDGAVTLQDVAMPNDAAFYRIVVTGP